MNQKLLRGLIIACCSAPLAVLAVRYIDTKPPLPSLPATMHYELLCPNHECGLVYEGSGPNKRLVSSWVDNTSYCWGISQNYSTLQDAMETAGKCAFTCPPPVEDKPITPARQSCVWHPHKLDATYGYVNLCVGDFGQILGLVRPHDPSSPSSYDAFVKGAYCEDNGSGFDSRATAMLCIARNFDVKDAGAGLGK